MYSGSPPVGCPNNLLLTVKKMQGAMGCRSSKTGCSVLGNRRAQVPCRCAMSQRLWNMHRANSFQEGKPIQAIPGLVVYPKKGIQGNPQEGMGQGLPGLLDVTTNPNSMVPGLPSLLIVSCTAWIDGFQCSMS